MPQKECVEYTYTSIHREGMRAWKRMFRELFYSRELIYRFFVRDFVARYKQSVFGYIWVFAPTIIAVVAMTYIKNAKIVPIAETEIAYPVFVLLGMTIFQFFSSGIVASANSIVGASNLVAKINFTRETLVFASFGQSLLEFMMRTCLVIFAFLWFHIIPAKSVIFIPFVLIPFAMLTIGLGFFAALMNAVFRDVGLFIALVVGSLIVLTPVMYPAATEWPYILINFINPVSPFVIAVQDLTIKGYLSQPELFVFGCALSILYFFGGWRIFNIAMPRVIERI
ncbi:MAG: ABC transporter permease [Chlamydiota bacterium]|nr:ABC transporter permease [Chlamydiota bacterium]